MKEITGDKLIGVIIYIYMEISQGNSLCSCLYLKQAKMLWFSFYLFSYKIGQQKDKTNPVQGRGLAPGRGGRCWGKGVGG
jgi:hypothetical protein